MSSRADISGTPGKVSISPDVIIRQGNGVNYSFSEVATIDRLQLNQYSIQIDELSIGAVTSSGYLSNELIDYDVTSNVRWIGTSTDATATVSYTVSGFQEGERYQWFVDGVVAQLTGADTSGSLYYTHTIGWSTHEFIIQKAPDPSALIGASWEYVLDGNLVTFTDKSYGGAVVWIWNFGDGYGSTAQNPTHKYIRTGVYQVSLTVYDSEARSSTAQTNIEIELDADNPFERDDGGWNVYISETMTISVHAIGLVFGGAILFMSGVFFKKLPVITQKGRKLLGVMMMVAGVAYYIFLDNSWMV